MVVIRCRARPVSSAAKRRQSCLKPSSSQTCAGCRAEWMWLQPISGPFTQRSGQVSIFCAVLRRAGLQLHAAGSGRRSASNREQARVDRAYADSEPSAIACFIREFEPASLFRLERETRRLSYPVMIE